MLQSTMHDSSMVQVMHAHQVFTFKGAVVYWEHLVSLTWGKETEQKFHQINNS